MKPVKQKIFGGGNGDCFRACMASMLELPNDERLPHIDEIGWRSDWDKLLKTFGMTLNHDFQKIWRNGYWIASVPSLNIENGLHAIIMFDSCVAFDPSTKKCYEEGRDLFLEYKMITAGWWLEVSDVRKLKEFYKYRLTLEI